MLILYKNDRNVGFVLFTKTLIQSVRFYLFPRSCHKWTNGTRYQFTLETSCLIFITAHMVIISQVSVQRGGLPDRDPLPPHTENSPRTETPSYTVKRGRYASYWNVFLFTLHVPRCVQMLEKKPHILVLLDFNKCVWLRVDFFALKSLAALCGKVRLQREPVF